MIKRDIFDAEVLSDIVVQGMQELKAKNIVRMDLRAIDSAITDYFVVCTATSDRHAQAIADSVEDFMKQKTNSRPSIREGVQKGEWILLDYVNVIVHIFLQERREFFRLEAFWGDAKFEHFADM
ncbi:MAG: ribosome silencing factor [Ferruginibacter sp.]